MIEEFFKAGEERFGEKDKKTNAHHQIFEVLTQGSVSAMEYFQKLDDLLSRAGYDSLGINDSFNRLLLERVKVAINSEVAIQIAMITPEVTTYADFKTKASAID